MPWTTITAFPARIAAATPGRNGDRPRVADVARRRDSARSRRCSSGSCRPSSQRHLRWPVELDPVGRADRQVSVVQASRRRGRADALAAGVDVHRVRLPVEQSVRVDRHRRDIAVQVNGRGAVAGDPVGRHGLRGRCERLPLSAWRNLRRTPARSPRSRPRRAPRDPRRSADASASSAARSRRMSCPRVGGGGGGCCALGGVDAGDRGSSAGSTRALLGARRSGCARLLRRLPPRPPRLPRRPVPAG